MNPLMIDEPGTRDRDDALHVEATKSGWTLTVHVADVASRVAPGSVEDLEARRRRRTFYGATHNRLMLPGAIQSAVSLTDRGPRAAMVIRLDINPRGEVISRQVERGILERGRILPYADVVDALGDPTHHAHTMLTHAERLARVLLARRREAGALAIYDLTRGWATNEDGVLVRLGDVERNIGYVIVQESMIAASAALAVWAAKHDVQILFRNHMVAAATPSAQALATELDTVIQSGSAAALEMVRERMQVLVRPAVYGEKAGGHYALNLPMYAHATSPIRRYADLVNQRQIFARLDGKNPTYTGEELAAIAEGVNTGDRADRTLRNQALKERAHNATRAAIRANAVTGGTPREFSGLIKRACKEGLHSTDLVAEARRRALDGTLSSRDMFMILLVAKGPAWHELQEEIIRLLVAHPEVTVSLLAMHVAEHDISPVDYTFAAEGPDHRYTFSAQASLSGTRGAVRRAPTKRAAQQLASLSLLSCLVGFHVEDPSEDAAAELAASAPKAPPIFEGRHPVSVINESAQAGILSDVHWKVDRSGADHVPMFVVTVTATCHAGALEGVGKAPAKAGAREKAAAVLVERLQSTLASVAK